MKKLNQLTQLSQLPFSLVTLAELRKHLTLQFDSIAIAEDFWISTNTVLWQLDSNDTLPDDPLVEFALQYPECVMHIDDKWYLLLGIVSDSGQGVYVVFPNDTCVPRLQSLLAEMTHG